MSASAARPMPTNHGTAKRIAACAVMPGRNLYDRPALPAPPAERGSTCRVSADARHRHAGPCSDRGPGSLVNTVAADRSAEGSQTSETGQPTYVKAATYLLANGIPAFAKDAIRREQRTPRGLDPDLAVNRSFSLAAKLQLQRDRDLERTIENTMAQQKTALSRYALNSTLGFDLWW